VTASNYLDRLADGPYLNSRTIYDFDLDNRVLVVADYDCILPSHDMSIPPGRYCVKQINKEISHFRQGRVHHLEMDRSSFDDAAAKGALESNAYLRASDGSIVLEVTENFLCSSRRPILFTSKYEVPLSGRKGRNLLYAGAVQPSDYTEFNRQFGQVVPGSRISKEIVIATRSKQMYIIRYFDGSNPCAFPTACQPDRNHITGHFTHRWSMPVVVGSATRAFYFAVAVTALTSSPPQSDEFLPED